MASVEKKSKQLGMAFGTACGRLRKLVLFDLLQQRGDNVCFRCEMPIESADALSIEHKKPWLDVDPALFWDLSNIAWAHQTCNSGARRWPGTPAQVEALKRGREIKRQRAMSSTV